MSVCHLLFQATLSLFSILIPFHVPLTSIYLLSHDTLTSFPSQSFFTFSIIILSHSHPFHLHPPSKCLSHSCSSSVFLSHILASLRPGLLPPTSLQSEISSLGVRRPSTGRNFPWDDPGAIKVAEEEGSRVCTPALLSNPRGPTVLWASCDLPDIHWASLSFLQFPDV